MNLSEAWEQRIDEFERRWVEAPPPDLWHFTMDANIELRQELILVDLERRYRSQQGTLRDALGNQPTLQDYVRHFASHDLHLRITPEMVAEEYRIRSIWGDQPDVSEYQQQFPQFAAELPAITDKIACEIDLEKSPQHVLQTYSHAQAPLRYNDFELQRLVGSGGVAKVYRCWQKSENRLVALKALRKQFIDCDWVVDAFLQEAAVVATLQHQNIVRLLGVGQFPGGGIFQVMEFIDGPNMRHWMQGVLRSDGPSTSGQEMLAKVATAISYAHKQHVVHCDLKPENILIGPDRIAIADFGMARFVRQNSQVSKVPLGGSKRYSAPEIVNGFTVSPAADVYSIGIIGEELISLGHLRASCDVPEMLNRCRSALPHDRPPLQELIDCLNRLP